jgi:anti-sigma factor ChrR (cupin superfamily)
MISEQRQEHASLYALGALGEAESRAFEAELRGNAELRELVRGLQRTMDLLAMSILATPLPPSLRDKVLQWIEVEASSRKSATPPALGALAGLRFVDSAGSKGWKQLPVPGAFIKLLSLEMERGYAVLLGKLERGVRYPAHTNPGPEDFYILTGDLVIGDRKLVAGDFHHADKGSRHAENYSVEGCTLLAVLTTDDPLVALAIAGSPS